MALAVVRRRHAQVAVEGHAHALLVGKAALAGDLLQVLLRMLQQAARRLQPEQLDRLVRRVAGLLLVDAGEVPWTHAGALRQHGDRDVGPAEMIGQPQVQLVEGCRVLGLRLQQLAVLRLPAGALEEHHQLLGDLHRRVAAAIVFDQGQRQVDAGGDAGRGPGIALLHEDRLGVHAQRREAPLQFLAHGPVGGDPFPFQQTGLGQQEGAGADRGGAARRSGVRVDPVHRVLHLLKRVQNVGRARHHDGVDHAVLEVAERPGVDAHAFGRLYQSAVQADGVAFVAGQAALLLVFRRDPERGLRAGQVQQSHLRKGDEEHQRCGAMTD